MEEGKILINIPSEGNYIEILGHKIDGYNSFEAFLEDLKDLHDIRERYKELEEENLHWKGQYHLLSRKIDVIPASIINNKIMKLNLEMEKLQIEYEKEVVNAYKQVNLGKQTMLSEKVKLLQELLEERNK